MNIRRFLLSIPVAGCLVFAVASSAVAFGSPSNTQTVAPSSASAVNTALLQAFSTKALPGNGATPAVVARVGGTEISGAALARQIAMVQYTNSQRHEVASDAQVRALALDHLIRLAAMHERAVAEVVTVSDGEVLAWLKSQAALRQKVLASNPQARADFAAMMAAQGDADMAAYDRDAKTVQEARLLLEDGKLLQGHLGTNASGDAVESFVQETIKSAQISLIAS